MSETQQYFVRLVGTREGWPDNMTPDEEAIMEQHLHYLKSLVARGKVLMAGPVFEGRFGLVVLNVASVEEARSLMDHEPSVTGGVHTYALSAMRTSLVADHFSPGRHTPAPTERELYKEIVVRASLTEVWKAWTTTDGIKSFLSPNAEIELRVGGKYEVFFDMEAPLGSRGSEGCRVLSFLPKKMLSFEWNAPPQFEDLRFVLTRVVLFVSEDEPGGTRVDLHHMGWGEGEKWDQVYDYFDTAWEFVLTALKTHMEK